LLWQETPTGAFSWSRDEKGENRPKKISPLSGGDISCNDKEFSLSADSSEAKKPIAEIGQ